MGSANCPPAPPSLVLLILPVIFLVFLQGCTVINFGVGAAIDGPGSSVHYSPWQPSHFHSPRYVKRIHTRTGEVVEVGITDGFFIGSRQTNEIFHISYDPVDAVLKDGSEVRGWISHVGMSGENRIIRIDDETDLPVREIDELQFIAMRIDTVENQWGSSHIENRPDSIRTHISGSDISGLYLGYDHYYLESEPYLAEVGDIEKLEYRWGMGILPYALAGAGLVVDVVVGLLILIF